MLSSHLIISVRPCARKDGHDSSRLWIGFVAQVDYFDGVYCLELDDLIIEVTPLF